MNHKLTLPIVALFAVLFFGAHTQTVVAPNQYLIEFTDKNNSPYSIDDPLEFLSERAIERRQNQGIEITEQDIPVNPAYIDSIKATGATVTNISKWFNSVIIFAEDDNILQNISAFTFVRPFPINTNEKSTSRGQSEQSEQEIAFFFQTDFMPDSVYGYSATQIKITNGHILHTMGYRGEGINIAILDGGFPYADSLEVLGNLFNSGRLLGTKDFVYPNAQSVFDTSLSHHGTDVLATMAAQKPGEFIGVAPQANYLLIRTEKRDSEYIVEEENWISALEYADSIGIDLVSSSLNYLDGFDDESMDHSYDDLDGTLRISQAASIASEKGILVVVSGGNNSHYYCAPPADANNILAIGAIDYMGNRLSFSPKFPTADGRIKPDLVAIGSNVFSQHIPGEYFQFGGTSAATPVIAGLVACLWQSDFTKSNMEIIDIVRQCASQAEAPDNNLGYGIPDFAKALCMIHPTETTTDISTQTLWSDEVLLQNNVIISDGGELIIAPGTTIAATGFYSVSVNGTGRIIADGLPQATINFTHANQSDYNSSDFDTTGAWNGIRFENIDENSQSSVFNYCAIENCKNNGAGGAFYFKGSDTSVSDKIVLQNCIIRNCNALQGAGIYTDSANLVIQNCVVDQNVAQSGGAMFFNNSVVTIINNTIVENSADTASGIFINNSSISTFNSIVWNNTDLSSSPIVNSEITSDQAYYNCNIQNGNIMNASIYVNCIDADPLFMNAESNDYTLTSESPCIDSGDSIGISGIISSFDINGSIRILDSYSEMGAYEYATRLLQLSHDSIYYDYCLVDEYGYNLISIINIGNSPVQITSIEFPECFSFYSVPTFWSNEYILPDDTVSIFLCFYPEDRTEYQGNVIIYSNQSNADTAIYVNGFGAQNRVRITVSENEQQLANANITLNGVSYLTNNRGVATMYDLEFDEYNLSISADGYRTIYDTISIVQPLNNLSYTLETYNVGNNESLKKDVALELYPNPFFIDINIVSEKVIDAVYIEDMSGNTVYAIQNVNSLNTTVNLSNLTSGLYILKVTDQEGNISFEKIIKE